MVINALVCFGPRYIFLPKINNKEYCNILRNGLGELDERVEKTFYHVDISV